MVHQEPWGRSATQNRQQCTVVYLESWGKSATLNNQQDCTLSTGCLGEYLQRMQQDYTVVHREPWGRSASQNRQQDCKPLFHQKWLSLFLSPAVRTCCCISTVLLVYDLNSILYLQPQHTSTVLPQYFYCIVTVPLLCCCCTSPLYFCCTCTVHPLCCHCTCTVHSLCCCNTCTVHLLCCHCTCSVHLPCCHCTSTTLHCTVPNVQVRKTYLVPSVSSTVNEVDVDTVQSPQVEHTKR